MKLDTCFTLFSMLILGAFGEKVVIGYYESWKSGTVKPEELLLENLTHLNYAFGLINQATMNIDIDNKPLLSKLRALTKEKKVKLLVSVGGWSGSKEFSTIVSDKSKRSSLVSNVANFLKTNDLDGVDFDWEYPGQSGAGNKFNAQTDTKNYFDMVVELREKIGDKVISLCGSLYPFTAMPNSENEISSFVKSVDFINVMGYHYYGMFSSKSGPNAPIYSRNGESVKKSMDLWLNAKIPKEKLVVGVPTFGVGFSIKNYKKNTIFQELNKETPKIMSKGLTIDSTVSYEFMKKNILDNKNWEKLLDEESQTPYCVDNEKKVLISYEDEKSIGKRTDYALKEGYKGIMIWSLALDNKGELLKVVSKKVKNSPLTIMSNSSKKPIDKPDSSALKPDYVKDSPANNQKCKTKITTQDVEKN